MPYLGHMSNLTDTANLLPSSEVARLLHMDVRTVHRWVRAGRLTPVVKAPGKRGALLFSAAEVERLAVSA